MDLKHADVLAVQTKYMRNDVAVRGFSAALTPQIRKLAEETRKVAIYSRIDELPEDVLDILAWQFSVDWYDPDGSIEVKRKAIMDALLISRIKGTPAAVERVAEIYLGDAAVEEWWEYGSDPGYFRIVTANPAATAEKATLMAKVVAAVKRLSAHLEAIVIITSEEINLYHGLALQTADNLTIEQVV